MGKKEKEIKRINAAYYKERNRLDNSKKIKEIEFEKNRKIEIDAQEAAEKQQVFLSDVIGELKGYSEQQGLPLCEYLDEVNLENYINFVLEGCPSSVAPIKQLKKHNFTHEENPTVKFKIANTELKSYKDKETEKLKHDIIIKAGEYDILSEYLKEHYPKGIPSDTTEKIIMDQLRVRLIRISGGNHKYTALVEKLGKYHYNNTRKKLNL